MQLDYTVSVLFVIVVVVVLVFLYPPFPYTKVGYVEHQGMFIFRLSQAIQNTNSDTTRPGISSDWPNRIHLE